MDHFPSVLQGKAGGFLPVPEIGDDPNGADITFYLHKIIIFFFKASRRWKYHQQDKLHFLMSSHLNYSKGLFLFKFQVLGFSDLLMLTRNPCAGLSLL